MTSNEKLINDCVSPFNEAQRAKLKSLCRLQIKGRNYTAEPNAPLEEYIATLKALYPNMFQSTHTLKHRTFVDEPTSLSIPFGRFVRSAHQSPYKIVPVDA